MRHPIIERAVRVGAAFVVLLLIASSASAQIVTDEARLMGYVHRADTTWFVFDAGTYGAEAVERVVVTGAFRGWSQDMADRTWLLLPHPAEGGVWTLAVPNAGYDAIPPSTPFKFRIDDGRWLDPPAGAEQEGGNLVFLKGVQPPRLQAELRGENAVWASVSGVERPLDASAYRLVEADGDVIPVAQVLPYDADELLVVPAQPLDARRVYYLEAPGLDLSAHARFDGIFRTLYSDKPLGAEVVPDGSQTTFRLFAPRAEAVRLHLYRARTGAAYQTVDLTNDANGVWETTLDGDLHGVYYDYTVHGGDLAGEPGTSFFETHPVHVTDPYARVSDDSWGRARVWRKTTPATPVRGGRPAMEDVIAYEVHVQDFTDALPASDSLKGTFAAMARPGLTNAQGEKIGFDYLVDLGINTVHLMPVQEFLHYPDTLWQRVFGDDPYAIAQDIARENYQWGYRTTHAFALESRFRTKGTEPGAEREQFRDMVQAFHDKGIAVIVDLVPNHTGENMDGGHLLFNFNVFDKAYYYRLDDSLRHIGPFGNEVKFEERPMVQRWLIDQCRALVEEFGIDGFRIDLAGQVDEQTLIALKAALPDDLIIYGEPWIPPSDPDVAGNPDWAWYKVDAPITFFQDEARNAFKGPTSNPQSKATDRGYAGGDASQRPRVLLGLTNGWEDEGEPKRGINYLDIHDNWALADQFATTDWNGLLGVDEGPFKVAAGLLFTSLGPVVLHGGTEIMRSKGSAPLVETLHPLPGLDGVEIAIHGKRDSYNMRRANRFLWETVGQTPEEGAAADFAGMYDYWQGLIALRNSDYGSVFRVGEVASEGYYRWILPANERLLGYVVDEKVLVLVNVGEDAATFDGVDLPDGSWRLVADADQVNLYGLDGADAHLGGGAHRLEVPATSLKIWVRE